MKLNSRILKLALAVLVAITSGLLAYNFSGGGSLSQTEKVEAAEVYLVQGTISRGTSLKEAIDSGLVNTSIYPKDTLPVNAIGPTSGANLDFVASSEIPVGMIVTQTLFVDPNDLAIMTGVPLGKVAVTYAFKTEESVAGLLSAGDVVSVFVTSKQNENGVEETKEIVQSALIIQIGEKGSEGTSSDGTRLVTLALDIQTAANFIHAAKTGSLHIVLLNPASELVTPTPVTIL